MFFFPMLKWYTMVISVVQVMFSSMLFINFAIIYNYILELYNFVHSVPFQEEDKQPHLPKCLNLKLYISLNP